MRKIQIIILILISILSSSYSQSIKNGTLWQDDNGNPIQAHGVDIMEHDGVYYMIGNDMTDSYTFKGINLYSSTNLIDWAFENTIIDENTNSHLTNKERITERPCLLYNEKDDQFVVWLKYQNSSYTNNKVAIFHSPIINGKYTYEKEFFPKGYDSNDCSFFSDDDGTAYYISTNKANGSLNLYKLSDDYMDASEATVLFANQHKEAPVLFRKDNLYYILCSSKTGWEPNQMKYATSASLTSGWSNWKNIGDQYTFDTQPTDVITIKGTEETSYLYVGDRWKSPTLAGSKTLIMPLEIDNETAILKYTHEFKIDLTTGKSVNFDSNEYVPQEQWSIVSTSSEHSNYEAAKAIDGDLSTIWHTNWSNGDTYPHEIVINLGASYDLTGLSYIARQDNNINGNIDEFQLYTSEDGNTWKFTAGGNLSYWSDVYFEKQTALYVKFVAKKEFQDKAYAAVAELRFMTNNSYSTQNLDLLYSKDLSGQWKTSSMTIINPGQTIEIGARPNIYGAYSWTGPNGFYTNTRIAKLENIDVDDNGIYTLAYLDEGNNCHTAEFQIRVNGASGLNDNTGTSYLVYPNPSSGLVNIDLEGHDASVINVYTINGILVESQKTNQNLNTINSTATLKEGIYILEIMSQNKTVQRQTLIIK